VLADRKECRNYCIDLCDTAFEVSECKFDNDLVLTNIPAVSEWGMVVMLLLVVAAGTIVIRRARAVRLQA